jgi:hypothetical protein
MLRNGGPAWTGTVARRTPESAAGMDRNTHPVPDLNLFDSPQPVSGDAVGVLDVHLGHGARGIGRGDDRAPMVGCR